MSLTSGSYIFFLAGVFFVYWMLSRWPRLRVGFILAASYYFYALLNWKFVAVLLALSTVDFLTARSIGAPDASARRRKLFLTVSLLADIGALFTFKYFNFFSGSIAEALNRLGWHASPLLLRTLAPLGLSFIAFRSLSYVVDVYRRQSEPTARYFDYLAFVAFFPTILAGPLARAKQLLPQFRAPMTLTSEEGSQAIFLIVLGLVKKIAVADYLANNLVGRVFDQPQLYSSVETMAAIYGYALQIYFDFSGYSDIAIGSALLLGFRLPVNFNSPYRAASLPDFWRRWHITLSEWLRDYVFCSIPGSPRRPFNLYRNAVITMLVGGLWHGAGWTFLAWGGMHGLGVAVNQWWEQRRRKQRRKARTDWWVKPLCVLVTFHFVCLTWVFFRAASLRQAWDVLARLGAFKFEGANLAPPVLAVLVLGYLSHWIPKGAFEKASDGWAWLPSPVQAGLILSIAYGLYYLSSAEVQFIYGNF